MLSKKDFGLIFWIHLFLIIFSYSSFIWLDWKLVVLGGLLLKIYYMIRGGCDISFMEFGNKDTTFIWYYLQKIFPKLNKEKTQHFLTFLIPIIIFPSILFQVVFNLNPLVKI